MLITSPLSHYSTSKTAASLKPAAKSKKEYDSDSSASSSSEGEGLLFQRKGKRPAKKRSAQKVKAAPTQEGSDSEYSTGL